jgi:hypothetical protein
MRRAARRRGRRQHADRRRGGRAKGARGGGSGGAAMRGRRQALNQQVAFGHDRGSLRPDRGGRAAQVRPELLVRQGGTGSLGKWRGPGEGRRDGGRAAGGCCSPAGTVMRRSRSRRGFARYHPDRDRRPESRPPMCIRHDVSAAADPAPDSPSTLSGPSPRDVGVLDATSANPHRPPIGAGRQSLDRRK